MIDGLGVVRCEACNKKHAERLSGYLVWKCPRCNHVNVDDTNVNLGLLTQKVLDKVGKKV